MTMDAERAVTEHAAPRPAASPVETPRPRSPWSFVPPLYAQQGAHYFLVDTALGSFLASMGVGPSAIGHASSLVTLPWSLKGAWSPLVELHATKRKWIVASELLVLVGAFLLAAAPVQDAWFAWTVAACTLIAIAAATADVAIDGFYLLALSKEHQSGFVGVRNTCFRIGRIVIAGGAGEVASWCISNGSTNAVAWARAFACAAVVYGAGIAACALVLPRPPADRPMPREARERAPFLELLRSWFVQPRVVAVLAFILFFRLGESMLTSMVAPFLQASSESGGLALSVGEFARAYNTAGVVALLAGGLAGGALLARRRLARWIWPMAIVMHAPNVLFLWAAHVHPPKGAVFALVATEQAAYGFGLAAYMVFLLQNARRSATPAAHYAISTGAMALAAFLARYWSGDLVKALGYEGFFVVVCLAALPGLAVLPFLDLDDSTRVA